jgi:HTH-type transcriptional regulator/antitoxin HigA
MSNDTITAKLNYAIHPGEILQDTLDAHDLSQKDLASRTGVTPKHINEIIKGKASITSSFAQKLEFVFETSSGFWLGLQKNYEEIKARLSIDEQFKLEEELISAYTCYNELSKLKLVKDTRLKHERYTELLSFFRVSSLNLVSNNYSVQFRKTDKPINTQSMAAWLRMGEIQYNRSNFNIEYDEQKFKDKLSDIKKLTVLPIDIASKRLELILRECGVFIAFTPYLKQTYVNGATRWLGSGNPLIQVTARTARSDAFWFTVFHEVAHILKHSRKNRYVEWTSNHSDSPDEVEANQFAANTLISDRDYKLFLTNCDFSPSAIKSFSGKIGVGQDIVAGRLAKDEYITWPSAQRLITHIQVRPDAI